MNINFPKCSTFKQLIDIIFSNAEARSKQYKITGGYKIA